jgi:hypothetical protein
LAGYFKETQGGKMGLDVISIIATISLALIGYFMTYWNNLRISKRQSKLDLINKRISEFYGPLYVSTQASKRSFDAMKRQMGLDPGRLLKSGSVDKKLLEKWRIWLENVFMPINDEIENLIVNHAYLILEEEMPECMLDFITHISAYRAGLGGWKKGDPIEIDSIIDYPKELDKYAANSYHILKEEQLRLIGYMYNKKAKKKNSI